MEAGVSNSLGEVAFKAVWVGRKPYRTLRSWHGETLPSVGVGVRLRRSNSNGSNPGVILKSSPGLEINFKQG